MSDVHKWWHVVNLVDEEPAVLRAWGEFDDYVDDISPNGATV